MLSLFPSLHASNAFNQYNKIVSFLDEEEVIPPKLKKSVKQPETKARKEVVHVKERYQTVIVKHYFLCYLRALGSLSNNGNDAYKQRHLESEFPLPQTLSYLFHLVQFVRCW